MGLRERLRARVAQAGKSLIERVIGEGNETGIGPSHSARTAAWPPERMGADAQTEPPTHPVDLAEAGETVAAEADFAMPMELDAEVEAKLEPPEQVAPKRVDPEIASAMLWNKAMHAPPSAPTGSVAQGEWLPMPTPSTPTEASVEADPAEDSSVAEPDADGTSEKASDAGERVQLSAAEREAVHDEVIATLKTVYDPEIPVDIYELGLIYGVDIAEDGTAEIRMTLTSPNCPAAQSMPAEVETKTKRVPGITDAMVDIVWDPPWGVEKMSEAARLELNID